MLESGLHSLITSSSDFAAIAGDRLFPVLLPEESMLPAATYQTIATTPLYALDERVNLTRYRIQFDTWSLTYSNAKSLAEAIRAAIDEYRGQQPDGSFIDCAVQEGSTDMYESAARIYRVTADYIVHYMAPPQ